MTTFTFRNVDNEEGAKGSGPAHGVHPRLLEAGVDADVDDGETQDDEKHDVLGVPPEHLPSSSSSSLSSSSSSL